MKRGTPRHPKTYLLAEALGVRLPEAVGILEMLWHHAAQFTPQGDIGSLPDSAIAEAVGWTKKPSILRDGLISSGWIENVSEHRLVLHDWPDHCEQSVIKWLEYNHKDFLSIYGVSLENRKRMSGKSLASREAKAEVLAEEKAEGGPGETKPDGSYETDFRAALLKYNFGNPENDPAVDIVLERTAAVCAQAGADPRVGAMLVVDLMRTQRCKGKPLEYLLGALRSTLNSPAHQNGTGLRKAAQ